MEDSSCSYEEEEEGATGCQRDKKELRQVGVGVVWVGPGGRVPVVLFRADIVQSLQRPLTRPLTSPYRLTFKIGRSECRIVYTTLLAHGFSEVPANSSHFNLLWTGSHMKPYMLKLFLPFQKINHFPSSSELTRKDKLCRNVQHMQLAKGLNHFNIIPKTFILPEDLSSFQAVFRKQRGTWIAKPVASSRGRGISLINHPSQLPRDERMVVSQYVDNPLCVDGFKFDMRLYVAVTSYNPLRVYLFEEGLARFATVPYEGAGRQLHNLCMHLTNYSVNKKSIDYVRCDDPEVEDYGNKWSMSALLRYLQEEEIDVAELMMRVEDVVIKAIICGETHISAACRTFQPYRGNCFEIYGFDILVDDNLQPWLLEVNLSPSLACDAPMDLKIKSSLVADLLSLAGIPIQDPFTGKLKKPLNPAKAPSRVRRPTWGGLQGLSAEEAAAVRETREEHARRGGFVRIFPSEDSWELYGSFLDSKSSLNYMLHKQLYPERVKHPRPHPVNLSLAIAKRVQSASDGNNLEPSSVSSAGMSALQRAAVYLRRLGDLSKSTPVPLPLTLAPPKAPHTKPDRGESALQSAARSKAPSSKPSAEAASTPPSQSFREIVDHVVENAAKLSKFQARQVFAAYLECVQKRLLKETSVYTVHEDAENTHQTNVDLVVRFLKKAAVNLRSPFTVVEPNHRLPLRDRRRILAKQLTEFVTLYKKETIYLCHQETGDADIASSTCFPLQVFTVFLSQASELDLERLLSAYARQSRSSAVFLGCEKPAANSDNSATHRTSSLADHRMPVGKSNSNAFNSKVEGDCSVVPSTSIARGSQAHHSSTTPALLPTYSWAGNIPLVPTVYTPPPPKYSEELLQSSSLPSHDQRSLTLLTKSLAGWSSRHKESASRTAKKDTASGAKLRAHQRSLSLQSLSSAASDAPQKTNHSRKLSSATSTALEWVESTGSSQSRRPQSAIISKTMSYVSPYAQPAQTKLPIKSRREPEVKPQQVPYPSLHPAMDDASISQALQRLTQRQNARKYSSGRPVIAQAWVEPHHSQENSANCDVHQRSRGMTKMQLATNEAAPFELQHSAGMFFSAHGGSSLQPPSLSPPNMAESHAGLPESYPSDLYLRIQTHNQAVAHHLLVQRINSIRSHFAPHPPSHPKPMGIKTMPRKLSKQT